MVAIILVVLVCVGSDSVVQGIVCLFEQMLRLCVFISQSAQWIGLFFNNLNRPSHNFEVFFK